MIIDEVPAISFEQINDALKNMVYGSSLRVMFLMMVYTGCRGRELNGMTVDKLFFDGSSWLLYWLCNKQNKYRKEFLPVGFVEELRFYWSNNRVCNNSFFSCSYESFRRYFYRERKRFGKDWQVRGLSLAHGLKKSAYLLQLKGLRKTFQTARFKEYYAEWSDPSIALQFTAKRMNYDSDKVTVHHYLRHFDQLGSSVLFGGEQKTLLNYL
jgi:integrase